MLKEFVVTRSLLVLGALALLLSMALRGDQQRPAPDPYVDFPPPSPELSPGANWEEELLAEDIQALWLERRQQLDTLSRHYRSEADGPSREVLRREMERIIEVSEREVYDLRLQNARNAGNEALVTWLERARGRLTRAGPDPTVAERP